MSIEFWLRFESQTRSARLEINFLFVTVRDERKVRMCVKLCNFFRRWILIRLTWILPRFSQNWVETLGWNFRKKLFWWIFRNFVQTKAILYRNLWNSGLSSEILFSGPYCAEKNSHKHFRMWFAPRKGGTSINESQKEDTGKKIQDLLFSKNQFCSISVWDLLRLTPWVFWSEIFTIHSSLYVLSFDCGLSPWFVPQDW